jgi:hypothetical protein
MVTPAASQVVVADASGNFSATWHNVPTGSYWAHAIGIDRDSPNVTSTAWTPNIGITVVPPPLVTTSPNWSGYVAETNLTAPQANSVTFVSGSWIVPRVVGPTVGSARSSVWVGIDGYGGSTVEQIGTEQNMVNGRPTYSAWWEMYSTKGAIVPGQGEECVISSMTISPGDSITASVQYMTTGPFAGQYHLTIVDNSRPNDSFSIYEKSSATQNPAALNNSAEWVAEDPGVAGPNVPPGKYYPLANIGTVSFTDASATINGITGTIDSPSWQAAEINMYDDATEMGKAATSTLTHSGGKTSFTVEYQPIALS